MSVRVPRTTPRMRRTPALTFEDVTKAALALPDVEATVRYDGSPVLKSGGIFLARPATHPSAEPNSIIVRCSLETREAFLEDAPDTYYVTAYYEPYPVVLARLAQLNRDAVHDLLSMSWQLTRTRARRSPARVSRSRR